METQEFKHIVWNYYNGNRREMPWRHIDDPYKILVSEVMLQQTQVPRVMIKYLQFIEKFPTVYALAQSTFPDVLEVWQGLGYNRRALWLQECARAVVQNYGGKVPDTTDKLTVLKGIGKNTAAAIVVYAYNKPEVFIETNIRTVYIHHFFHDSLEAVTDADLFPLIHATVDRENPRDWYYALMDYGTYLKSSAGNISQRSSSYRKQSALAGSVREVRGALLRELSVTARSTYGELFQKLQFDQERFEKALNGLQKDKLILIENDHITLST